MIELDGPIRPYAWGSRSFLAQLQGRAAPSPTPEAELWLGAHPDAPARANGTPLTDLIAADPRGVLGGEVVARFGDRLPYLLKLLAADAPLSIQVHPDADQAREGFARQEPGTVRTYTDPYPKPELLVAITPFEALCGFRDPDQAADHLAGLSVPALEPVVAALRDGAIAGAGLDVFEEEPLPPEHPLWEMENVIITPHSAGSTEYYTQRALAIFLENLKDVLAGAPPSVNRVTMQTRY